MYRCTILGCNFRLIKQRRFLFKHAFLCHKLLFSTNFDTGNGDAAAADDIWDDASESEGHGSILDREWAHRQNQFLKVYNDSDL